MAKKLVIFKSTSHITFPCTFSPFQQINFSLALKNKNLGFKVFGPNLIFIVI